MTTAELKSIFEALIYVAEEPISEGALVDLVGKEHAEVAREALQQLLKDYESPESGLEIREVANGYKMATKPEHHEWVRKYLKHQTPPTKLSLAALETLAVIAYRQPITVPEIQDVRGVNAVSVLKSLLDKKLITTAGRKNVIGRPILYKTTKEFLVHFGLKNLEELPSLEEFEDLARSAAGAIAEPTKETVVDTVERETARVEMELREPEDVQQRGEVNLATEESLSPPAPIEMPSSESSTFQTHSPLDARIREGSEKAVASGSSATLVSNGRTKSDDAVAVATTEIDEPGGQNT
jgi:segregation and condensation protein B